MGVARELNTTAEDDDALRRTLSDMERQLMDINATVASKQQQIDDYLTSGFAGSKLTTSESIFCCCFFFHNGHFVNIAFNTHITNMCRDRSVQKSAAVLSGIIRGGGEMQHVGVWSPQSR